MRNRSSFCLIAGVVFVLMGIPSLSAWAQPPVTTNLFVWLAADNVNGDDTNPANGAAVSTWVDRAIAPSRSSTLKSSRAAKTGSRLGRLARGTRRSMPLANNTPRRAHANPLVPSGSLPIAESQLGDHWATAANPTRYSPAQSAARPPVQGTEHTARFACSSSATIRSTLASYAGVQNGDPDNPRCCFVMAWPRRRASVRIC